MIGSQHEVFSLTTYVHKGFSQGEYKNIKIEGVKFHFLV